MSGEFLEGLSEITNQQTKDSIGALDNIDISSVPDNEMPSLYWEACIRKISALEHANDESGAENAQVAEFMVEALKNACEERGYKML